MGDKPLYIVNFGDKLLYIFLLEHWMNIKLVAIIKRGKEILSKMTWELFKNIKFIVKRKEKKKKVAVLKALVCKR